MGSTTSRPRAEPSPGGGRHGSLASRVRRNQFSLPGKKRASDMLLCSPFAPERFFAEQVLSRLVWAVRVLEPEILRAILQRLDGDGEHAPCVTTFDGERYLHLEMRETPARALESPEVVLEGSCTPFGQGTICAEGWYEGGDYVFVVKGRVAKTAATLYKRFVLIFKGLAREMRMP